MRTPPIVRSFLGRLLALACLLAAGLGLLFFLPHRAPQPPTPAASSVRGETPARAGASSGAPFLVSGDCSALKALAPAADDNAASLNTAVVSPFGTPEAGWAIYAPMIAHEIGTPCAPTTVGFADDLSAWQHAQGVTANGRVDGATLSTFAAVWLMRRPFVLATKSGCPAAADETTLARAAPAETWGGKALRARPAALEAYRRMVGSARADIGAPPPLLTLASAFRGPMEEAARCSDGSCGTARKADCSAHRTGLAFDVYLGAAPGRDPFSTADDNRLFQTQTPAYLWLVNNASRFGFVPYPFEPWHWEWTGESV